VIGPDGSGGPDVLRVAARFDAFVFTGGDDPKTEPFGQPTHPKADVMSQERQAFEVALLEALSLHHPDKPVLGVCLGMQLMALVAGGRLNQHLPDDTPTSEDHLHDHAHAIVPSCEAIASGEVTSHHHQAVSEPGRLRVSGRAHDGVIESIDDPARAFYLGVQWHPERTPDAPLGRGLFDRLVSACRSRIGATSA
jgi:putative glutamine amidotransferase